MATYRVRNANPDLSNGYVIEQQVGGTSVFGQQITGGEWVIINRALTAQQAGQIAGNLERIGDVSYPAGFGGTFPDYGLMEGAGDVSPPSIPQADPTADPFSFLTVDQLRLIISDPNSTPDEISRAAAVLAGGGGVVENGAGGTGRTGPTAAELAIERSKVDAQNLATFISGTIAELELEIDAKRLSTEQALGEFNRRLDAFAEAGSQFQGIQPYTIPIGAEYAPGFQPGGVGEQLGIAPRPAEVIQFDPFAIANEIVAGTPDLTEIGVPSGDALADALEIAQGFLGV